MADEIQEKLEERFRDAFVFDPILVREEVDEYGDPQGKRKVAGRG